jgi:hypothetical protein
VQIPTPSNLGDNARMSLTEIIFRLLARTRPRPADHRPGNPHPAPVSKRRSVEVSKYRSFLFFAAVFSATPPAKPIRAASIGPWAVALGRSARPR